MLTSSLAFLLAHELPWINFRQLMRIDEHLVVPVYVGAAHAEAALYFLLTRRFFVEVEFFFVMSQILLVVVYAPRVVVRISHFICLFKNEIVV